MIRKTKPTSAPYDFSVSSAWQCTWYVYYRCLEEFGLVPCYYNRAKRSGAYTNAKEWLDNFKEPFTPIRISENPSYIPVVGDVVVFNGTYGHVVYIEDKNSDGSYLISQCNLKAPNEFSTDIWTIGSILKGYPYNTGKPIGYLHFPRIKPTERNINVNQIEVTTNEQNIRNNHSLNADKIGFALSGYYNVSKIVNQDGFDWYQIEKNAWIAGVSNRVIYHEKNDNDLIKRINELENRLNQINELSALN